MKKKVKQLTIAELAEIARNIMVTDEDIKRTNARFKKFDEECERKHRERTPGPEWYRRTYTI